MYSFIALVAIPSLKMRGSGVLFPRPKSAAARAVEGFPRPSTVPAIPFLQFELQEHRVQEVGTRPDGRGLEYSPSLYAKGG